MAHKIMSLGLAFAVATAILSARYAVAQTGCVTAIISLAPCLGFMTGNTSVPGSPCCSALSSILQSQPQCLCAVLGGAASSLGVAINNTRALELPGACKVKTPPVSQCNAVSGAPAASPTASPTPVTTTPATPTTPETPTMPSGATTPATPTTPTTPSVPSASGTGSKTTPSTTAQSSDGVSTKSATISVLFLAALVSVAVF
ncbi:non-specific lipid-transfer protein-like protein At2g13820 [Ananas comosus]|uniref:Non-specific lipid-transfer protein-like protein At2g13820 n=1 Tax=Ananas comosus TaxID=4615 RepID=A0A6P5FHV7_ANACO|nr:non-specific lipid-transfer protein-like protein At2g13820 [Ananas comosus]